MSIRTLVCLWVLWQSTDQLHWVYTGAFNTEKACRNQRLVPPEPPPLPAPPAFYTICLPAGLHPADTGLFLAG